LKLLQYPKILILYEASESALRKIFKKRNVTSYPVSGGIAISPIDPAPFSREDRRKLQTTRGARMFVSTTTECEHHPRVDKRKQIDVQWGDDALIANSFGNRPLDVEYRLLYSRGPQPDEEGQAREYR